jgi:hypothetical protein
MPYKCTICNKEFLSNSGYWKHNKKYHQSIKIDSPQNTTIIPQNITIIPQNTTIIPQEITNINLQENIKCNFCNKYLSRIDSLKRHEIKCKYKIEYDKKHNDEINKLENDILKNEIEQLKLTLQKILENQTTPNILNKINKQQINNKQNNTINNNTINIVKFGTEDLQNIFTEKQMFNLINKGGSCINESIKYIHFNDKKPEYVQIKIL